MYLKLHFCFPVCSKLVWSFEEAASAADTLMGDYLGLPISASRG
jgi:hypothetical protein